MSATDTEWMRQALTLARQAAEAGEVPVGAVLVRDNAIIGRGFNQSIALADCSAHAEIQALRDAGRSTGEYRYPEATLYCTLEPCAMCAGALVHARIARLVYAVKDTKTGAAGSVLDLLEVPEFNHRVLGSCGVLADESAQLLTEFFRAKR